MASNLTGRRVLVLGFLLLCLALTAWPAAANHPASSRIEQHFELLAESLDAIASPTDIAIARGELPGGTGGFDPAPTPTLEIVARHTGGFGDAYWRIQLRSSGGPIASVDVTASESTFHVEIEPFAWPVSDTDLATLHVDRINGSGVAGTLEIRKAYLKLTQTGVIKKTIGRVPLGTKVAAVTDVSYADVANPAYYRHVATDFYPAPTIRLRASGSAATRGRLDVRLVDCGITDCTGAGSPVTGSTVSFTSITPSSAESGSLNLTGGHLYKLQTRVIDLSSASSNSTPPSGNTTSESGGAAPIGEATGADLVLAQSTTDTHGLRKVTSFFPGVTAARDVTAGATSFLLRPPAFTAYATASSWHSTAKRTSATGWIGADLDQGAATPLAYGTQTSSGQWWLGEQPTVSTPGPAAVLDTLVRRSGATAAGRLSATLLRVVATLRAPDLTPPVVTGLSVSPAAFSPNPDQVNPSATFTATLADDQALSLLATFVVKNASGQVVETLPTQTLAPGAWQQEFDGVDAAGAPYPDGTYTGLLTVTDEFANARTVLATVVIDVTAPALTNLAVSNPAFSPNIPADGVKDTTAISVRIADLSAPVSWRVEVRSAADVAVRTSAQQSYTSPPGYVSWLWDGRDDAGAVVPDATYTARVIATDAQALTSTTLPGVSITVDTVAPTLDALSVSPTRFTPHAAPAQATFAATSPESLGFTLMITAPAGQTVRFLYGNGTTFGAAWDGRNATGVIQSRATYTAALAGRDPAGNGAFRNVVVELDPDAPSRGDFRIESPAFSPNVPADGVKDTLPIDATVADTWPPISWTAEVKTQTGTLVRSWSGQEGVSTSTLVDQEWDGLDASGARVADGSYAVSLRVTDGGGNVGTSTIAVILDTLVPDFDPYSLTPGERSNTVYTSQPLVAWAKDPLSGIDLAQTSFALTDETTNATSTYVAGSLKHSALTGWLKTASPVVLAFGHRYHLSAYVRDLAGNLSGFRARTYDEGGGFLVTDVTVRTTTARIPAKQCQVSAPDVVENTRVVTCTGVGLTLDPTTVTFANGSRLSDRGYVEQVFDLEDVLIKHGFADVGVSTDQRLAYSPSDPAWGPRVGSMPYDAAESSISTDFVVSALEVPLGTLVTTVPAHWSAAYLELTPTQVNAAARTTCDDPSAGWSEGVIRCSSDPLQNRIIAVLQDQVADPVPVLQEHELGHGVARSHVYEGVFPGYAGTAPPAVLGAVIADARVRYVVRDRQLVSGGGDEQAGLPAPGDPVGPYDPQVVPEGVRRIHADAARNGGKGVEVAVLDMSVDPLHPDLGPDPQHPEREPALVGAFSCVGVPPVSVFSHGTWVAGIIAARDNEFGVVGVAPESRIWSVAVSAPEYDTNYFLTSRARTICGLEFVFLRSPLLQGSIRIANISAGLYGKALPVHPRPIGVPCGDWSGIDPLHTAVCEVDAAGVIIVTSAGNGETDFTQGIGAQDPARYPEVLVATGLGETDGSSCGRGRRVGLAPYDPYDDEFTYNFGPSAAHRTFGAPATLVLTTNNTTDTVAYSRRSGGTSFSAPHVAGVIALFMEDFRAQDPNGTWPNKQRVVDYLSDRGEPPGVNFRPRPQDPPDCGEGSSEVSHRDLQWLGTPPERYRISGLHPEKVVRADTL